MLKKNQLAVIYILIICFATMASIIVPKLGQVQASEEAVVIPKEAIRLRILANSDLEADQKVKRAIRDEVNASITKWVEELTSLEEARNVIKGHLPDIQQIAENYVKEHGLDQDVKVNFGQASFPTKLYGKYLYPAGEYEAIVITLGKGQGANWWCVLFPPLCFLDFSNGTAVSVSPMEEEEVQKQVETEEKPKQEEQPVQVAENEVSKQEVVEQVVNEEPKKEVAEKEQTIENEEPKQEVINKDQIIENEETEQATVKVEQVIQNEEPQVIEKKVFVVELFKHLFE